MQEQIVSFETAKLAKEKGFDIGFNLVVYKFYVEEYGLCEITGDGEFLWHHVGTESCDSIYDCNGDFFYDEIGDCYEPIRYHAPAQSLLQKWLREEHNIHIDITIDDLDWSYRLIDISKLDQNYEYSFLSESYAGYKTYEEALEKGLQEALKLI